MLGLFLFLTLPPTAALLLGLGVGWLGRWVPAGRFWCFAWGVGALLLPAASLRRYIEATVQAAALAPQRAATLSAFRVESLLLFALVAGVTLWGAWRAARWTPAPLLALFPVF